ncbi:MAG: hypothetical protein EOO99_11805 [Pedobacter sp.]|nr:MAG: hypothetical protein EOO99_11805 [Pedobacter sp.]
MKTLNLKYFGFILVSLISMGLAVKANILGNIGKTPMQNLLPSAESFVINGDLIFAFAAIIGISIFLVSKKYN